MDDPTQTYQQGLFAAQKPLRRLYPFLAVVVNAYSDRMACDIQPAPNQPYTSGSTTPPTAIFYNVPVLVRGGIDPQTNEIWGEMETPQVNDYVVVDYIGPYSTLMAIVGTYYPFTLSYFGSNQTPVNSTNKQFTKALLAADELKTYRKICKSGTTIEVGEDGAVTIETPSGSYLQMKESDDSVTIEAHGTNLNVNTGTGGTVNLNGTGDYVAKYTELNTQLQTFLATLNSELVTALTAAGSSWPGVSLDISTAQSSKVQVGG